MLFKDHFKKQYDDKIKACEACRLKDKGGPVLGYGSLDADVMIIGDAPHESDLLSSIPFTGKARGLLVECIKNAGLSKGEYYLTYMTKCCPDKIEDLGKLDMHLSMENLYEEIEMVNPRIILSMGFFVSQQLLMKYKAETTVFSIKNHRGIGAVLPARKFHHTIVWPKRYIVPTWNPATDNAMKKDHIRSDALTIKAIRELGPLIF